mgnify:CR=1 FL=1
MIEKDKILLILDLDETLVYGTKDKLLRTEDFKVGAYFIYERPLLSDFLHGVYQYFKLAIWSSASDEYVFEVANHIIPKEISLEFIWGRSKCSYKRNVVIDDEGYYDPISQNHYN